MGPMRNLDDENKTSFRAIPEVAKALDELVTLAKYNVARAGIGAVPRTNKQSALCALLLWVAAQPEEGRLKMMRDGHRYLDGLLSLPGPNLDWAHSLEAVANARPATTGRDLNPTAPKKGKHA